VCMLLIEQIGVHNLFWYLATFGILLLWSRSMITEDYQVFDPVGVMQQITSHTHYMPKHWRGAENTKTVESEFTGLFKVKFCFII
jgi:autophagy-related protein 9